MERKDLKNNLENLKKNTVFKKIGETWKSQGKHQKVRRSQEKSGIFYLRLN